MLSKQVYAGHLARFLHEERPVETLSKHRAVIDLQSLRDNKWFQFKWRPKNFIRIEHADTPLTTQQPEYSFILRQSSDRFILMSTHAAVVDAFFRQSRLDTHTEFPRIDVGTIVSHLTVGTRENGREYRMGVLFGLIEGYGRALRTIGLWGDDIADTKLFHEIRQQISAYRISIRDLRTDREIASIGSQGEVSFYYRGLSHLDQTDRLFRFLTSLNAINWSRGNG